MIEERGSGASLPLWLEEHGLEVPGRLEGDAEAEVAVVGAGIAGLTTAYLLAREGRSVVVLDDGPVAGGESSRTTAHLSNAIDDRFATLEQVRGPEIARTAAEAHRQAIDAIGRIAATEGIECGFARVPGFLFAGEAGADGLRAELAAARRAGVAVSWEDSSPLPGWPGSCLHFTEQGQIHPLAYLGGLRRAVERAGGRIHGATRVVEVEGGSSVRLACQHGPEVRAGAAVIATNSPFVDRFAMHTKLFAYRTYAIAAPVPVDAVPPGLYWDDLDPYHYVRLSPHRGLLQLVVGGEDHKTGQADDGAERWRRLEEWARARFPQMGAVAARWSGQVLETLDGLAYIGRNPVGDEPVFIATGDSGMGITHGTIAGLMLADLVQGRSHPWEAAFDPRRKPLRGAAEWVRENLNVARQYVEGLRAEDRELAPGEGAVIERDGRKIAAYCDDAGELHERSAVCPHLQCVVAWNSAEHTWDCPCHGSRFDARGRVLNGPAYQDLEPVETRPPEPPDESRPRPDAR
jgi:glycine/D-amino acid oxidase-like deaminating enzyme/nitrite reductase/ring-hydroxylating ferredoxin subunit